MLFKKQHSKDFTIGRALMAAKEVIKFQNEELRDCVFWIYVLSGDIEIRYWKDNQEGIIYATPESIVDLRSIKDTVFEVKSANTGSGWIAFMPEIVDTNYDCEAIYIEKEYNVSPASIDKFVLPLVLDLKIATDTKEVAVPFDAIAPLKQERSYILKTNDHSVKSHALIFSKGR
jgi:hypothetical protein